MLLVIKHGRRERMPGSVTVILTVPSGPSIVQLNDNTWEEKTDS